MRDGRTRLSAKRRCSKPFTCCGWRSATIRRRPATSRPSIAAAIGSSRQCPLSVPRTGPRPTCLRPRTTRPPRAGRRTRPLSGPSTPTARPRPSRPSSAGPSGELIVRRCSWAAAATILTSLAVAAFGPRPIDRAPSHFSIALPSATEVPARRQFGVRLTRWAPVRVRRTGRRTSVALPARGQPVAADSDRGRRRCQRPVLLARRSAHRLLCRRPAEGRRAGPAGSCRGGGDSGGRCDVDGCRHHRVRRRPRRRPRDGLIGRGPARGIAPTAGAVSRRAIRMARRPSRRSRPALHGAHADGQRRRDSRRGRVAPPRPGPRRRVRPLCAHRTPHRRTPWPAGRRAIRPGAPFAHGRAQASGHRRRLRQRLRGAEIRVLAVGLARVRPGRHRRSAGSAVAFDRGRGNAWECRFRTACVRPPP